MIFGLLIAGMSQCQNLLPNPSFEDTVSCPSNQGQISLSMYWTNPTQATPDYFNSCSTANFGVAGVPSNGFGNQTPLTGVSYGGFYAFNRPFPNTREYIQSSLLSPLSSNHDYAVSLYVCLSDASQYSVSSIGAYFSTTAISTVGTTVINVTPQVQNQPSNVLNDRNNWILISGTFTAAGSEQYMTIGNFMNDNSSDTTFLGNIGGNNITYYYIDDVSVIDLGPVGIKENENRAPLKVSPNPSDGKFSISGFASSESVAHIEIVDVAGSVLFKQDQAIESGSVGLNLQLSDGIYFLRSVSDKGQIRIEKVVIKNF